MRNLAKQPPKNVDASEIETHNTMNNFDRKRSQLVVHFSSVKMLGNRFSSTRFYVGEERRQRSTTSPACELAALPFSSASSASSSTLLLAAAACCCCCCCAAASSFAAFTTASECSTNSTSNLSSF